MLKVEICHAGHRRKLWSASTSRSAHRIKSHSSLSYMSACRSFVIRSAHLLIFSDISPTSTSCFLLSPNTPDIKTWRGSMMSNENVIVAAHNLSEKNLAPRLSLFPSLTCHSSLEASMSTSPVALVASFQFPRFFKLSAPSDFSKHARYPLTNNLFTKHPRRYHPRVPVHVSHLVAQGTLGKHQKRRATNAAFILSLASASVSQPGEVSM